MTEQKRIIVVDLGSAVDMGLARTNADWILNPEQRREEMRIIDESMETAMAEFNAHHDALGRFAPGGSTAVVALSYHALGRIGKQGRASVTSVRDALEHLQSVKTPDGDWSYPVKQGDRLRGHLIGTDGIVKTVVGAWYKPDKLPPALAETALAEFNPWHDALGRFATGGGVMAADTGGGGGGGGDKKAIDTRYYGVSEHTEFAKQVRENVKTTTGAIAKSLGVPFDQYCQETEAVLKDHLDRSEVAVRMTEQSLLGVLQSGEFKTTFETKTTAAPGELKPYQAKRKKFERDVLGIDSKAPGDQRPIYGYYTQDHGARLGKSDAAHIDQYGDNIAVVLKSSVKERSTFTAQDSVDWSGYLQGNPRAYPSPYNKPSVNSCSRATSYTDIRSHYAKEGPEQSMYWEAQVYGRVRIGDIARVMFRTLPSPEMQTALGSRGITWEVAE